MDIMKKIYFLFLLSVLLISCSEKKKPVVLEGQTNNLTMDSLFEDTTKVLNIDLPDLIDSVNQILVHEIHVTRSKEYDRSFSIKKSKDYYGSNMVNLIFEDVINKKSYLLTNNQLQIISYELACLLKRRTGKSYILYRVIDRDYNNDGILDGKDISSLYISDINGTSFTKLTKDKENIRNGEWMYPLNRYYFRTLEDSNKDGYFDFKDKVHYYYLQFDEQGYQVVEYNPLEIFNK